MNFGESLRKARESLFWSRFRLAMAISEACQRQEVSISAETIKNIELGKTTPSPLTKAKIARVLPNIT
jgi:DNA-binding XRE family transcriptional regulator